jgi:hypothetical protein
MTNNQHAAILREIAKTISHYAESSAKRLEWDESMPEAMREVSRASIASQTAKAAALLAGAEALEAVEVVKAALLKVRDHARPTHREDADEVCYNWCPLCAVTAALARLEGR